MVAHALRSLVVLGSCGGASTPAPAIASPGPPVVVPTPPVAAPAPPVAASAPVAIPPLAPRKVPDGWSSVVDTKAGIAFAFPGPVKISTKQMSRGGRSGRMQEWAWLGDGEGFSVRMLLLDPPAAGSRD